MDNQAELRRRLNASKYLYLDHFGPSDDLLSLKVEVVEGLVGLGSTAGSDGSPGTGSVDTYEKVIEIVTGNAGSIEIRPESKRFVIKFDRYLALCVRDETYVHPEENEEFSKKLRTYEKSKFLDFVQSSTWWWDDDTSFSHHAVVCLNVVIDIVCTGEPKISIVETT